MKAQTEYSVHRAGRLQPILSQHREPVCGSVDGRPCVGSAGFSNALDLSQLMSCQTEWRSGLTNPMQVKFLLMEEILKSFNGYFTFKVLMKAMT